MLSVAATHAVVISSVCINTDGKELKKKKMVLRLRLSLRVTASSLIDTELYSNLPRARMPATPVRHAPAF